MDAIFRRLIASNFSDLKGARADLSIPVPQALINEFIKTSLEGNKSIASVELSIQAQNRVSVNVRTNVLPWPLNLKLKLDRAVDLGSYASPKMRAWLENNKLLGSLGTMLNVLPPGVKLYGDQVVLDLGPFLQTPEQKQLLKHVRSVGVSTEPGRVTLSVKIEVS